MSENSALLICLREGNHEAWRALSGAFRQRLRDLAESALPGQIGSRADASDIVQQTLSEASESFAAFHGTSLPELFAWLTAILNNNLNDTVRKHLLAQRRSVSMECHLDASSGLGPRWDGLVAADQTSPSVAAVRRELHDQLQIALENLPPRQRRAVRLRHLEGRTLAEIAAKLSCTAPAAAAVIARGLRALREAMRDLD